MASLADNVRERVEQALRSQEGAIFALPALVGRSSYTGRDVLAPNSRLAPPYQDERGYVRVEWWIMSLTRAANDLPRQDEGVTRLLLPGGDPVLLTQAARSAGDLLFGRYQARWPLTKVLDIGGEPVLPDFGPFGGRGSEAEVPPIPFHVHSGVVVDGRLRGPGKLEAYFFPPVDVPPYNRQLGRVITRLGVRPGVTFDQVLAATREFGVSDAMYALGNVFEVRPYDGWTIRPGTLHAPGPAPTFEIQLPQDDYHYVAWRLGTRLAPSEREHHRRQSLLRGFHDEAQLLRQAVDWEVSTAPDFEARHRRKPVLLEEGRWGRRLRIFFDEFYGEALEIRPGQRYRWPATDRPRAGIVWSGEGTLNGPAHRIAAAGDGAPAEFLIAPGHEGIFTNEGTTDLLVYTVFPMEGEAVPR
ncbi:hypothetical protein U7230_14795 [Carboxydochorda subterranea]|uniref:Uncharacterized protein n=1 Tax=Carboxydichorda subterranea TaxID=3109565 RepID=A0ABZ1BXP9_9FIRM|nr:hypothetical protein [Limnochorda sp. L945t]WRP17326.1 hypothetical protein U7230_14795 [Limnochorda sp. L945t]